MTIWMTISEKAIFHSIRNTSGEIHNYTNTTCCTVLSINLILLLAISKQNQDGLWKWKKQYHKPA